MLAMGPWTHERSQLVMDGTFLGLALWLRLYLSYSGHSIWADNFWQNNALRLWHGLRLCSYRVIVKDSAAVIAADPTFRNGSCEELIYKI